MRSDN